MNRLNAILLLIAPCAFGGDLQPQAFDIDKFSVGNPPPEIFVIDGSIEIKAGKDGKVIEISGDKREADAGAVIGPSAHGAAMIEARILASKAGRSYPRFGIGVHGQTGFRLYVVPARKELQLVKGEMVIKSAPFDWKSGSAVMLRLAISPAGAGRWAVTGKAWTVDDPEPTESQIAHETTTAPTPGQCSIWGTPYSGTPIDFCGIKLGIDG